LVSALSLVNSSRYCSVKEEQNQQKEKESYEEYVSSQDDRYLHMKVANRSRWSSLDNYDYWYDSRYEFCSCYCNTGWNSYNAWNPSWNLGLRPGFGYGYGNWGWSNPIYTLVKYTTPSFSSGGYTSGSNILAYKNRNYNNSNIGYKDPKTGNVVSSSNNNSFGNLLKRVFTSSSDNTNSYDKPARTFNNSNPNTPTPPPATSSSAGGTSGGFKSTGSSTSTGRGGKGS